MMHSCGNLDGALLEKKWSHENGVEGNRRRVGLTGKVCWKPNEGHSNKVSTMSCIVTPVGQVECGKSVKTIFKLGCSSKKGDVASSWTGGPSRTVPNED
ncbi:hypothetical protein NUU61_009997 [Penicillium alfredii]|uniref:Uncharacterized protein n=1 Tax=Penicillium alfredii TaxID=1506179 RepID=A0A9W9JU30_9EURO|nr:uncharacterized protein NUU61_009997 [Penicillium alfredii]KAJ5081733.1 hypothetical protein NUU61_009997 [Penicillium alfredii]